jgi:hypothetical protein
MKESDTSLETSKNSINTISSLSAKVNSINNNFESLSIKPKISTKFEGLIINAYKCLTNFSNQNKKKRR